MIQRFVQVVLFIVLFLTGAAHAEVPGPLASVGWLKENLGRADLVMLDIRSPRTNRDFYEEGHIPGAVAAPYNTGWRTTVDGVIGMLPPLAEITEHIGKLGVGNDSYVVILPFGNSSTDFSAATRVYWTFKVLGHDKVSILDGGYAAWLESGFGVSTNSVRPKPKKFVAKFRRELVASELDVERLQAASSGKNLVDARPAAQYHGKAKSPVVARAGTIPGAENLPQSSLYNVRKASFADDETIRALVAKADLAEDTPTIAFCNTGHWATIAWFAMSEVLGKKNVSVYDGSMAEWAANLENPVE